MIEEENDFASSFIESLLREVEEELNPTVDVFHPKTFDEYIGQEDIKKLLQISIKAAQNENRALPNLMIAGGFGLGKSVLADIVAATYGRKYETIDGNSTNKSPPRSGNYIIDEIHNVTAETSDELNRFIDNDTLHIIGCTTNPGKLSAAFRSRFRTFHLQNYDVNELTAIAHLICNRKGVVASTEILGQIARRSRFNARQVTMFLSMIFDLMSVDQIGLTQEVVIEAFRLLSVDENGYLSRDKQYVAAMPDRPIGLGALSAIIGVDAETIEQEIEPYLLQTGVIDRTPKGRIKLKEI